MKFNIKNFYNNIENNENTITDVDIYKNSFFNFKAVEKDKATENADTEFSKFVNSNYTFLGNSLIPLNINYYDTKESNSYSVINSLNINKLGSPNVNIFRINAGQIIKIKEDEKTEGSITIVKSKFEPLILKYTDNNEIVIEEDDKIIKTSFLFLEDHSKIHDNLNIPKLVLESVEGESGLFVDAIDYTTDKNLFSGSFSSLDNYITANDATIQYKPDGEATVKSTLTYTETDGYTLSASDIKEDTDSFCFFDVSNYITIFSEQEKDHPAGFEVFEPGDEESIKFLGDEGNEIGIIKVYCNKLIEEEATT